MRVLLTASALLLAGLSTSIPAAASAQPGALSVADRLSDPELDAIRGGQGVSLSVGGPAVGLVARDATMRDHNLRQTVVVQQFDNWMNDIGYLMIAANIYQQR